MPAASPVAYLALLLLVPLTIVAFAMLRPTLACCAVYLGSLLFLPERVAFDAPLIPPLGKESLAVLCIGCALVFTARDKLASARIGRGSDVLLWLMLAGVVGTVVTNRDSLHYGPLVLPGLTNHDLASAQIEILFGVIGPYLIGRALFRNEADARDLLTALVCAGVIYVPFVLFELRMSPQLHRMVYGFHQHSFIQTIRGGGWRPMVFMGHGLALAMMMLQALMAAWILMRSRCALLGFPAGLVAGGLTLLFPFIKSTGAIVYSVVTIPLVLLASARMQMRVAVVAALLVVSYPILRLNDMFPVQDLVDVAAQMSQDRAQSLSFRLENEQMFMNKALTRSLFGWGGYNRGNVFSDLGEELGIWDGAWIIVFSAWGIVGLISRFSLLLLPIFMARRRLRRLAKPQQVQLAGLSLVLGITAIDLLPNGFFSAMPLFLAGCVAGLAQGLPSRHEAARRVGRPQPQRRKRRRLPTWALPVHHWSAIGGTLPWVRSGVR